MEHHRQISKRRWKRKPGIKEYILYDPFIGNSGKGSSNLMTKQFGGYLGLGLGGSKNDHRGT